MKKVLIAAAALMISLAAQAADGLINFINKSTAGGVNAPVTYDASSPAALVGKGVETASGLVAQLFLKNAGGSFDALTPVAGFKTGATAAGVWDLKSITIPNATANMTFRVDVFDAGTSFDTATSYKGRSAEFTASPGIAPNPQAFLANLQAFTVTPVPEPTTLALGVLGAAALLARRKK